jgi:iron-sulfur cluster assembly protein
MRLQTVDVAFASPSFKHLTEIRQTRLKEVIEKDGVTVLIDSNAVMFLIGTEMDFVTDKMKSGFVFKNPNEKSRCGCGESFHV